MVTVEGICNGAMLSTGLGPYLLFELVEVTVKVSIFNAVFSDFPYRMQDGCVITPSKKFTDFRQAFLCKLF